MDTYHKRDSHFSGSVAMNHISRAAYVRMIMILMASYLLICTRTTSTAALETYLRFRSSHVPHSCGHCLSPLKVRGFHFPPFFFLSLTKRGDGFVGALFTQLATSPSMPQMLSICRILFRRLQESCNPTAYSGVSRGQSRWYFY